MPIQEPLVIRAATKADAARLGQFQIAALAGGLGDLLPSWTRSALTLEERTETWRFILGAAARTGETHVLIAERGGRMVGMAAAGPQRSGALAALGYGAELTAIHVARGERRGGLGRLLLRRLFALVAGRARTGVSFWALRADAGTRRFVEASGAVRLPVELTSGRGVDDIAFGWASTELSVAADRPDTRRRAAPPPRVAAAAAEAAA